MDPCMYMCAPMLCLPFSLSLCVCSRDCTCWWFMCHRSLKSIMDGSWGCGQTGPMTCQKTAQKKKSSQKRDNTLLWSCIGHCLWQSSPLVACYRPSWWDLWETWKGGERGRITLWGHNSARIIAFCGKINRLANWQNKILIPKEYYGIWRMIRVMRGEMEANISRKKLQQLNQDQYGIMPWYTCPYPSSIFLWTSLCHVSISCCLAG